MRLLPGRTAEHRSNVPDAPAFPEVAQRGALRVRRTMGGQWADSGRTAERARSVSGRDPCTPPFADRTRGSTLPV
ncbi:hypothetical protein GCM10009721_04590 [Terrabacter tumescens]|uniref:Uncharacterized protein n=1 Tax=Terrabacter tumescens TaxID=60443 RepID=A0ABQ2HIU1_9MICO|nr:hypothetical protein GCM10009721_04590 [Terrabacter tumescens]